jgi:hypothetical protein
LQRSHDNAACGHDSKFKPLVLGEIQAADDNAQRRPLAAASQRNDRAVERSPHLTDGSAGKALFAKLLTEGPVEEIQSRGSLQVWRRALLAVLLSALPPIDWGCLRTDCAAIVQIVHSGSSWVSSPGRRYSSGMAPARETRRRCARSSKHIPTQELGHGTLSSAVAARDFNSDPPPDLVVRRSSLSPRTKVRVPVIDPWR